MEAAQLALLLILLRIIAVGLLTATLVQQIHRLRSTATEYPGVRLAVFSVTILLLFGQVIPIILDVSAAFGPTAIRAADYKILGSAYAINNAVKDVLIGALLAVQYYRPRHK